jgi:hypothetical protein
MQQHAAVIQMYEHKLKELNPGIDHITYDISDLHAYVDSLQDLVALTYVHVAARGV